MMRTGYLNRVLNINNLKCAIEQATNTLQCFKDEFDGIAFTGMSGSLFAPSLAISLEKKLLCVRKETSHSYLKVEGDYSTKNYIIVDDFPDTGGTIISIAHKIKHAFVSDRYNCPNLVGIYFYARSQRVCNEILLKWQKEDKFSLDRKEIAQNLKFICGME